MNKTDGAVISGSTLINRQKASSSQKQETNGFESAEASEVARSKRALWGRSISPDQSMLAHEATIYAQQIREREMRTMQLREARLAFEKECINQMLDLKVEDCKVSLSTMFEPEVYCESKRDLAKLKAIFHGVRMPEVSGFPKKRVWHIQKHEIGTVDDPT